MKEMPDHRKRKECQRAERKNRRDRKRRILIVCLNGALSRNNGAHAAHCRANRKQRRKFWLELEQSSEKGHERKRTHDFDGYKNQAHAAQFQNVAEQKASAKQHNSRL